MADLHIFFLPFLAPGHMIPMVDMAKLFAARSVKATIVTTTGNASRIQPSLDTCPHPIQLLTLPFSTSVPENVTHLPTPDLTPEFKAGLDSLKEPFERLLIEHRPDCIVSDFFYPWSAEVAAEHNVPRIAFHGTSSFVGVIGRAISVSRVHHSVAEEDESFVVPGIPDRIELAKSQLHGFLREPDDERFAQIVESHKKTYGIVMNTFYDMEPGYTDAPRSKSWLVGPVGLCNRDALDREVRGGGGRERDFDRCLDWLGRRRPGSVLYVCFGSLGRFAASQLGEIATGLISSGHPFVWAVGDTDGGASGWIPEGFEGEGLIVRGWAPQMAILNHPAVGGFLTHCGWNSCLEGAASGVPMVTWPLFADQFFNERLLVDVVKVGFAVGSKVCSGEVEKRTFVRREQLVKAIWEIMGGGEEAEERRKRAREIGKLANKAVEEGGSSYNDLSSMIGELMEIKAANLELNQAVQSQT